MQLRGKSGDRLEPLWELDNLKPRSKNVQFDPSDFKKSQQSSKVGQKYQSKIPAQVGARLAPEYNPTLDGRPVWLNSRVINHNDLESYLALVRNLFSYSEEDYCEGRCLYLLHTCQYDVRRAINLLAPWRIRNPDILTGVGTRVIQKVASSSVAVSDASTEKKKESGTGLGRYSGAKTSSAREKKEISDLRRSVIQKERKLQRKKEEGGGGWAKLKHKNGTSDRHSDKDRIGDTESDPDIGSDNGVNNNSNTNNNKGRRPGKQSTRFNGSSNANGNDGGVYTDMNGVESDKETDDTCLLCGEGGELIVCDQRECPRVYHTYCVQLSEVPEGYWACPLHGSEALI